MTHLFPELVRGGCIERQPRVHGEESRIQAGGGTSGVGAIFRQIQRRLHRSQRQECQAEREDGLHGESRGDGVDHAETPHQPDQT